MNVNEIMKIQIDLDSPQRRCNVMSTRESQVKVKSKPFYCKHQKCTLRSY